jgi:hypothetical protein
MKEKIIKLTNAAYKVLEFLPESDPLKTRAKDKALAILEGITPASGSGEWMSFKDYFSGEKAKSKNEVLENIDILLGYLEVGKAQGWISGINFFIISNEYEKLKKELGSKVEISQKVPEQKVEQPAVREFLEINQPGKQEDLSKTVQKSPVIFTGRQMKIVDFLSKNGEAQVMDLQRVLPDVTKRTIRRDLDELLKAGRIVRSGEFNQVVYKLNEA